MTKTIGRKGENNGVDEKQGIVDNRRKQGKQQQYKEDTTEEKQEEERDKIMAWRKIGNTNKNEIKTRIRHQEKDEQNIGKSGGRKGDNNGV